MTPWRMLGAVCLVTAGAASVAVAAEGAGADPEAATAGLSVPAELPVARLAAALEAIVEADGALGANVNPVMALERMLLALRRQEQQPVREGARR